MSANPAAQEWYLNVVEDVTAPGWYLIPVDLGADERAGWVNACEEDLREVLAGDDPGIAPIDWARVRPILEGAFQVRDASPSLAIFQVWPLRIAAAVMCHVNILRSSEMPNWTAVDGVTLFPIEAPNIGPGLQCTVKGVDETDGTELVSLHYLFDDGETTLMLSLDDSLAPLIGAALPGFVALKEIIAMAREDGTPFASVAPAGVDAADAWPMERPS